MSAVRRAEFRYDAPSYEAGRASPWSAKFSSVLLRRVQLWVLSRNVKLSRDEIGRVKPCYVELCPVGLRVLLSLFAPCYDLFRRAES